MPQGVFLLLSVSLFCAGQSGRPGDKGVPGFPGSPGERGRDGRPGMWDFLGQRGQHSFKTKKVRFDV